MTLPNSWRNNTRAAFSAHLYLTGLFRGHIGTAQTENYADEAVKTGGIYAF